MKLIISSDVRDNISEIYDYIAKDSIKYANETVTNIYSRITELEISPYLGRYVPEFEIHKYRELLYKSYRIVYEISDETDSVYIHFVVHCKRNFNSFYKSYIKNH